MTRLPSSLISCLALALSIWGACGPTKTTAVIPTFRCPDLAGVLIPVIGQTNAGHDTVLAILKGVPLSGPIASIPEYHDCQRFIDSSNRYIDIFAIFAAFRLDTVDTLRAVASMPMATIYTEGGNYPALGIRPGFNCLFLAHTSDGWNATMIPWGTDRSDCADGHITPGAGVGTDLSVLQQVVSTKFRARDFPPVARWDRDRLDREYTIGIRCGGAWCEVGRKGFAPSAGYNGPYLRFDPIGGVRPSPVAEARVQMIKGWYDVQRLALPTAAGIQPTPFRGFLIPHPALDSLAWLHWTTNATASLDSYYAVGWLHVGYAYMEGDYPKWNFRKGTNKIYMCYGELGRNCRIPPPLPAPEKPSAYTTLEQCPADPTITTRHWWAKTISEAGTVTYVCIERMDHRKDLLGWLNQSAYTNVSFSLPATARWRFLIKDESGWWGCPTGCCTKQ